MEFKTKTKLSRIFNFKTFLVVIGLCAVSYYVWSKICYIVFHQRTQSWWYLGLLWTESAEANFYAAFTDTEFYSELFHNIYDDLSLCGVFILHVFIQTWNVFIFLVVSCVSLAVVSYSIYRQYNSNKDNKDVKDKNGKKQKNNVKAKRGKEKTVVPEISERKQKKFYWRWVTGLLFLAFLISIPWEFVRLYQSMVAEKVSQMKSGIPAECVPEEMTFYQRVNSFLRMQLSWAEDPCLVYHKALLVDPVWHVNPLMVVTSAISHCIVYPAEILFGGLGKALRLFFSEIPAQWQLFMLIIMVLFIMLVLVMTFGYRVHLPFLLKFEPKSPRYIRSKPQTNLRKPDINNLDHSLMSSQDTVDQSFSSDTQCSLESQ